MTERPRTDPRALAPIRGLAHRFAYLGLLLLAVALLFVGRANAPLMEGVRARVNDAVAPILGALTRPVDTITSVGEQVRYLVLLHEENDHLREDREDLLRWQVVARRLEAENIALHQMLNFVPDPDIRFVSGRVVADTGGAFAQSVLVNAGSSAGVGKGQAVITGAGLVGRIAGVADESARVLLITDVNSRVPVVVGPRRTRAILAGNNSTHPVLIHLLPDAVIEPGDRVVTSGHAGAFPPDLSVGVVSSVSETAIAVEPFVRRSRLDIVRIIDYGLTGILGRIHAAEDAASAPTDAALSGTAPSDAPPTDAPPAEAAPPNATSAETAPDAATAAGATDGNPRGPTP